MLNSSTYTPTDAELQQMVYGGEYHIPESQEVTAHAQKVAEREEHADFARWEQEISEATKDDFVLGYDEIDPNLFDSGIEPVRHGDVAAIETVREEQSEEDKMHEIIGNMTPLAQTRLIIDTGRYFVPNVRLNTVEMSRLER